MSPESYENMAIRRLTTAEAELFHAFRLRGLQHCPEAFGSTYEEEVVMPAEVVRQHFPCADDNFVLGAFDHARQLVGVAGFYRQRGIKIRHKAVIWGMYVVPEARGQRVGSALLLAVIECGRLLSGVEQIILDVVIGNAAARQLYVRHGFRVGALEEQAMKQGEVYYAVEHMVLHLGE